MKTSEIVMTLTKAIASNRNANQDLLISSQNAMFRLYEFMHLDGVIKDADIDEGAEKTDLWSITFDGTGYPFVVINQTQVRKMVRDAIRTAINLVDKRKGYADDQERVG